VNEATRQRLFGFDQAFEHPFVLGATVAVVAVLALAMGAIQFLAQSGRLTKDHASELRVRWRSWVWLALAMLLPILLGAAWVMAVVLLLSLLTYREYARGTGLFREKSISAVVLLGILLVTFANVDHYPRLFFATVALTLGALTIVTIPQDRPKGYLQRTALGVLGFLLFGYCFGYLGAIANDANYRPYLVLILLGVGANVVFAYCVGKVVGGPRLLPQTSPGKTLSGSLGALLLTTALVTGLGHFVFAGTAMERPGLLLLLGAGMSMLGQLGDLLLSSIKRDAGVKDLGTVLPGHGGLLDRFDSLVLVPPVFFHYVSLVLGPLGWDQPERILTGG
jgi:phosphatidate cytidylyltransferase